MEIRYMSPADDKLSISKIYVKSWKYAYRDILPQDYLNSISEGEWVTHLSNPNRKTLLCLENDIVVGTSSFSNSRLEQFEGWGEIISIYLLPEYMGKGYGKRLIEFAVSELKKLRYSNIYLWVLEKNVKARHFYEKAGFILTEDYLNAKIGGKMVKEVRYIYKG